MTIKVYMMPTPEQAAADTTNAIHHIVLKLQKHLPAHGVELVETPEAADLIAGHAGQGSAGAVDVAHCHGLYPTAHGGVERWHWGANKMVVSNLIGARAITVPSEWVADILRRDMHVSPHVVGWAIDADEWQPAEAHQGYVLWNKTRPDGVCNPEPMVKLAALANDQLFLSTFGEGVTPNVRVVGRQTRDMMKGMIQRAEVYLATTKETFGIGTLEAMACGVPVLGYRHGGTADIVEHGVTGYLVEPGDIEGLLEGLAYCKKHRDVLGANARTAALTYSWDEVAAQFADIYRRAMPVVPRCKVSVIIPVYNYGRFLREAMESVFVQETSFNFEVIVVDDGSTDNSAYTAERAFGDYPDIDGQLIVQENAGVAAARNFGIQRSHGQYIVCLDADDRLGDRGFLQILSDALDADRSLGIAFTSLTLMDEAGKIGNVPSWPSGYDFDQQAQGRNQVPTCCMFRREAWERAGGYRAAYTPAEDAALWLSIGALGFKAKHVTEAGMFHYRLHGNSLSSPVRTGEQVEPNWRAGHPWIRDNQRPFAADGQPQTNPHSWPVRNYDRPMVSIVVPVGPGHARYLPEALDSIEAQTFRFWETIVINDTGEPLDLTAYPWVKDYEAYSRKASRSRNLGIEAANAPLVAFLDADDLLHPEFLEKTLRTYQRHGRYVYTDWISLNKQGQYETHLTHEYVPGEIFHRTSIHAINVLIPRKWLVEVGGFDESMTTWEDVDLFMKLAAAGYCGQRVPEALLTYRYSTGSLREQGEPIKDKLKALLRERYEKYMTGETMCSCFGGATEATSLPPSPGTDDADMVYIEYTGEHVPQGLHDCIGPATRTNYQDRGRGDRFFVWRADFEAGQDRFVAIVPLEQGIEKTPVPPAPELIAS